MTARTTSCFGGRFTLTGEILGRRSMRASDPPPVTMEEGRGSTNTYTHRDVHRRAHTLTPRGRTSTHVRSGGRTHTHVHVHVCVIRETSLFLSLSSLSPPIPSLSLSLSLSLSRLSVSLSSRTYGTVCHGQKLWQGVQGVQNQARNLQCS